MTTTKTKEILQTILSLALTPEQKVAEYMNLTGRMEWSSLQKLMKGTSGRNAIIATGSAYKNTGTGAPSWA